MHGGLEKNPDDLRTRPIVPVIDAVVVPVTDAVGCHDDASVLANNTSTDVAQLSHPSIELAAGHVSDVKKPLTAFDMRFVVC